MTNLKSFAHSVFDVKLAWNDYHLLLLMDQYGYRGVLIYDGPGITDESISVFGTKHTVGTVSPTEVHVGSITLRFFLDSHS